MLRLYKPRLENLGYRQALLSDKSTMSYNERWDGTIDFPKENWGAWYKRWVLSEESDCCYRTLYSEDVQGVVGEAAYHYDTSHRAHMVNIFVEAKYRGLGYGKEGLLLLMEAAKKKGIPKLCDDIAPAFLYFCIWVLPKYGEMRSISW